MKLLYGPVIPFLSIYPRKFKSGSPRDILHFHVYYNSGHNAYVWKQLKCLSTDEWIKKIYKYNSTLFSLKIERDAAIFDSMDEAGAHFKWNAPVTEV